jgi:uncharacterized protein (TIGR02284 family)
MTKDIDVLNDVTKTLIDSRKGYETCCEVADDSFALQSNFQARAQRRRLLVKEFQDEVRSLGGEPQDNGSITGSAHRAWTEFTSLFSNDQKAAAEAIDDGEEHLAKKIEDKLDEEDLTPKTRLLLAKAVLDARDGESFADKLEAVL